MRINLFPLLVLLICIQCSPINKLEERKLNEKCCWIRPVSWKYISNHDIQDSSVLVWDKEGFFNFILRKTGDSSNCLFYSNIGGYMNYHFNKIYLSKEYRRYQWESNNDIFILPAGNYTFEFVTQYKKNTSFSKSYRVETETTLGFPTRVSYNVVLKRGKYNWIVFILRDNLDNQALSYYHNGNTISNKKVSMDIKLIGLSKEDIVKAKGKTRK
jgi:hypothetical protein